MLPDALRPVSEENLHQFFKENGCDPVISDVAILLATFEKKGRSWHGTNSVLKTDLTTLFRIKKKLN